MKRRRRRWWDGEKKEYSTYSAYMVVTAHSWHLYWRMSNTFHLHLHQTHDGLCFWALYLQSCSQSKLLVMFWQYNINEQWNILVKYQNIFHLKKLTQAWTVFFLLLQIVPFIQNCYPFSLLWFSLHITLYWLYLSPWWRSTVLKVGDAVWQFLTYSGMGLALHCCRWLASRDGHCRVGHTSRSVLLLCCEHTHTYQAPARHSCDCSINSPTLAAVTDTQKPVR